MQAMIDNDYEVVILPRDENGEIIWSEYNPVSQPAYTNKIFTAFEHLPIQYQVYIPVESLTVNYQKPEYTLRWKVINALFFLRYELLPALQEAKRACNGLYRYEEK